VGRRFGPKTGRRHGGTNKHGRTVEAGSTCFGPSPEKWVAVRKTCILIVVATVLGLAFFEGTASATATGWKVAPYLEVGSGTVTSTAQDVTTSVGKVFGTPVARGTTSGSEVAASPPPPCGSNPGSPVTGSVTTTASNGSQLNFSFSGTVCVSATTSSYTRYRVTSTVTVTGGTGEFANATGGGEQYSDVTLYPTADGTQGPFTSFLHGAIRLAGTGSHHRHWF